jgi:transposase
MDPAQLALLLEALAQEGPAAASEPEAEAREDAELERAIEGAEHAEPRAERTRRPPGPGWQTRGVPREVHRVEVPEAERTRGGCGRAMTVIGEDISRRLECVPAHFVEHEYHRAKYACGTCKDGLTTAPAPPQVLERSAAGASLLAHVVVSQYADHTPLHRLSRIDARSGVQIPVSTLADWTAGMPSR